MKNFSINRRKNTQDQTIKVKNYELWDFEKEYEDTNRELEFHSINGNVKLKVKNIDRDLVPEGFKEAL